LIGRVTILFAGLRRALAVGFSVALVNNSPVPANRLERSLRATFLGIAVNIVLGCAKFAAGILGHSHALIADATESFADIFNSLIVWRGIVVAETPADDDHPYGHGKAEPLAAAFGAVTLLLAAFWIAFKAANNVAATFDPHSVVFREPPQWFTLLILGAVVLVKEGLFRFVLSEGNALENPAVTTDAWHHRSDAITSIAAAIGIAVALIGGRHFVVADDIAAIFAALVIGFNGFLLLRPAISELMDKAPDRNLNEEVLKIAGTVPGVDRVEKCFVRKMGYQFYAEMHIEVDPQMTVLRSHEIAHAVKNRVREQLPRVSDVLVHIEPLGIPAKKPAP
jgi:cation diffusion facilitator family transporter